jgi:CRISPR/Cas system-associated exonuclease Cas4 (RecB family)
VEAEPVLENERHLQQGAAFHLMVQQHLVGVPVERLSAMALADSDLAYWWQSYLDHAPAAVEGLRVPEAVLSAPVGAAGQRRLVAVVDLVVITPEGKAVIFDWKTSRQRPPRSRLAERLQTRVYPYLLAQAGQDLTGGQPLAPERIEMVYWFAGYPDRPERFVYSAEQQQEDGALLERLVEQIATLSLGNDTFPLTPFAERCQFCVYRSLCNRGVVAGSLEELGYEDLAVDGAMDFELDFEQVIEVEY